MRKFWDLKGKREKEEKKIKDTEKRIKKIEKNISNIEKKMFKTSLED